MSTSRDWSAAAGVTSQESLASAKECLGITRADYEVLLEEAQLIVAKLD